MAGPSDSRRSQSHTLSIFGLGLTSEGVLRSSNRRKDAVATVGIVGLGLLGHAIASRLLAGGHQVVGYDVLPDKVGAVTARGGKSAQSAAEVARASELVCTVLPSLGTA